jgi:hypothetical protein
MSAATPPNPHAPDNDAVVATDFFVYHVSIAGLQSATATTESINIQADSDFELQNLTYFATEDNADQTASSRIIPLVDLQITDTGSGRQLFQKALPLINVFGTGELPFILPRPKIFRAKTQISLSLANFNATSTYDIELSFIGRKIFRVGM